MRGIIDRTARNVGAASARPFPPRPTSVVDPATTTLPLASQIPNPLLRTSARYAPPNKSSQKRARVLSAIKMKKQASSATCSRFFVTRSPARPDLTQAPPSERHEFVLPQLQNRSGAALPKAVIVYSPTAISTPGKITSSSFHPTTGRLSWLRMLIGSDLALDPSKLFHRTTELSARLSSLQYARALPRTALSRPQS